MKFSNKIFSLLAILIIATLSFFAFRSGSTLENIDNTKVISASPDRMNVFYIGIDNPLTIAVENFPCEKLEVTSNELLIEKKSRGKYIVKAQHPGIANIKIAGEGFDAQTFEFRIKRIADPIPVLGSSANKRGGSMLAATFSKKEFLSIEIPDFLMEVECEITGFSVTRVAKGEDPIEAVNKGAAFSGRTENLMAMAAPGSIYYFDNIKAQCPGDDSPRKLASIVFKIR